MADSNANFVRQHFSVSETAQRLGLAIPTIRGMVFRRELEIIKIGRRVFVTGRAIEKLLADGLIPAGGK
ncbi:MAG: helix-turn-helix domain-containing protein [Nitrospiria bacterium]